MPGRTNPPRTPSPKSGRTGKITDFKSTHQSEPKQPTKRELEVENLEDDQPAKRPKRGDNPHVGSNRTTRYQVNADTPKARKPASARLLGGPDGGLRDSFTGRWDFLTETNTMDSAASEHKRPKSPVPVQGPVSVNNPKRKRLTSSRLLDDTDGGLADSLVGRFETVRYEQEVPRGEEEKSNDDSTATHYTADGNTMDDTLEDDTEAETIKADDSEDGMSSDENRDDEDSEEDSGEGEDIEGDDSDKENVDPRDRSRAPSPPSLPATPGHHGNQSHDTAESTPRASSQPSASPSSFLLPSPVVDLPPLPSSPSSSSPLAPELPSTLPSPPSSP